MNIFQEPSQLLIRIKNHGESNNVEKLSIVELVITEQGVASIDIAVVNDKELRAIRTVKPPSAVAQNQWVAKKVFKEPTPKVTPLTRTQNRRLL